MILNATASGEATALVAEFKLALNAYVKELVASPVRSLAEVIAFNEKFSDFVSLLLSTITFIISYYIILVYTLIILITS